MTNSRKRHSLACHKKFATGTQSLYPKFRQRIRIRILCQFGFLSAIFLHQCWHTFASSSFYGSSCPQCPPTQSWSIQASSHPSQPASNLITFPSQCPMPFRTSLSHRRWAATFELVLPNLNHLPFASGSQITSSVERALKTTQSYWTE